MSEIFKEKPKDWRVMEFFVPIKETTTIGNDFLIRGIAINETTTRNGITYIAEELEKAAESFRKKPILLDHDNSIKSIVGRTTENVNFNVVGKHIDFEAKIMDKKIKEMINDGRITDVSIGVRVEDIIENKEEGTNTAIGLEGLEISLVAVPGDPGANLSQAMANSIIIKEKMKGGISKMAEEEQKTEPEAEVKETPAEEPKEEVAEEKIHKTEVNVDMTLVTEALTSLRTEIAELKKLKETDEEDDPSAKETPKEEPKVEPKEDPVDETKGVVGEEPDESKEEVDESIKYEKAESGKGFQIWRDFSNDTTGRFKRLVR